MMVRPILAALLFTSVVLGAAAASACPWADAQANGGDQTVASSAATGDQTQPSKPN